MKKICLATTYNQNYKEISKIVIPNMVRYCDKHNIDFYKTEIDLTNGRTWVWNKLAVLQKILPLYDWVLFIDTDCLFMNHNINLRQFIDDDYSIVIGENFPTADWFKEYDRNLEFGVAFFHNIDITYKIISEVYNDWTYVNHWWAEQYTLMKLLEKNKEYNRAVKRIESKIINTFEGMYEGPEKTFIYHVAGGIVISFEEKRLKLEKLSKEVIY